MTPSLVTAFAYAFRSWRTVTALGLVTFAMLRIAPKDDPDANEVREAVADAIHRIAARQ